ncbi:RNA-dependent RNA polymerase [Wenling crustacean virus 12]|uniref:RNA-directed RNA polymerase n=1 Tax=Wenling crustacean virus 12 TaxID=1923481 RepID=A0A1L3KN88_9MONO|nr:RNA-dependent RNA polymerase [Wenling crustacean virus 12]APG78838.1 RNA-dependent RNA polymerase [Wenling crustacean virus 12]
MFEDITQPSISTHVYRRARRVTAAITASNYFSWKEGYATEDVAKWFDRVIPDNYDILSYQRNLYQMFWRHPCGEEPCSNIVRSAVNQATLISTVDWCNINYEIDVGLCNQSKLYQRLNKIRTIITRAINELGSSLEKEVKYSVASLGIKFEAFEEWVRITRRGCECIMPWLGLIAFEDSMIGLTTVLMMIYIEDDLLHRSRASTVEQYIVAGLESVAMLGYQVYDILKQWLPLTVGNILSTEAEGYDNALLQTVVGEVPDCPLKTLLLREMHTREDKLFAIELVGLQKCFTYPIVNLDTAVDNVTGKAGKFRAPIIGGYHTLWTFRKIFCREYIRKHKVWPPHTIVGPINPALATCIAENKWGELAGEWHPDVFRNIQLDECLEFDWHIDTTDLLTDKSIACPLHSWVQEYDSRYHNIRYGKSARRGPPAQKRLILKHLATPTVDTRESIKRILSREDPNNYVCVMCAKERELSWRLARYFTKLTFDMRMYQTTLEDNMKKIMQYYPHQSMTMGGNTLAKTILKNSITTTMKVHLDFTKWCMHMCYHLVTPLAKELDRIFGLPGLYESIHILPQEMYTLFQDRTNPPEQLPNGKPKPGPRCHYGLNTLGEGMFQKVWTTVTGCAILYHLYSTGYKVNLLGSGDNQVALVDVPSGENPHAVQMNVLAALARMSEETGLPIKLAETFVSNHYYEYGRSSYLDGKKVSAAIKRCSRIGTDSQEALPSLNSRVGGIHATAIACAGESVCPIPAYAVAQYESGLQILSHSDFQPDVPRLSAVLLTTRAFGGLKISGYSSYALRGNLDPLCSNIHIFKTAKRMSYLHPKPWKGLQSMPQKILDTDFEVVLKDPYALSFSSPKDAELWLRDIVSDALPSIVQNLALKVLFSSNHDVAKAALVEDLEKIEPVSLKLLAAIYQYGNPALKERAIGRYQSSTSVNLLVGQAYSMMELYNYSSQRDKVIVDYFLRARGNVISNLELDGCPVLTSDNLRVKSLKKDLVTPSMPPVQHQITMMRWDEVPTALVPRTIRVTVAPSISNYLLERGPYKAYLGSDTRIKHTKGPLEVINPDTMERSALSLAQLETWVGEDPNLQDLLDRLIKEKTESPVDTVKDAASKIVGGSLEHRGEVMTLPKGAHINYDPNISSHMTVNTDTATAIARKQADYTIMLQGAKVYIGSYIIHQHIAGQDVVGEWGAVIPCHYCLREVYDGEFSMDYVPTYPGLPLGMERAMVFKSLALRPGRGDPVAAYHAYLGEELSQTVTNWDRIERVIETDTIDGGTLSHNSSINVSELARANIESLLIYTFAYISISEEAHHIMSKASVQPPGPGLHPAEVVVDTLMVAGQAQNLVRLVGGAFGYQLENRDQRIRLITTLYTRQLKLYLGKIEYVLPFDSSHTVYQLCSLKNDNVRLPVELPSLRGDLERVAQLALKLTGIRVAPPRDTCCKALRQQPLTVSSPITCSLDTDIKGGPGTIGPWILSNTTTYGLTAKASQVWSLIGELPQYPAWTLDDKYGAIGVILGHRGFPSYILDGSRRTQMSTRITNGPVAIYYDECTGSYQREYYIHNLCSSKITRPPHQQLLVICSRDPRSGPLAALLRDTDIILSRTPVGGPLIGWPRRYESDIWYLSTLPPLEQEPRNITFPASTLTHYTERVLAPYVRGAALLKVEELSSAAVWEFVSNEVDAYKERKGLLTPGLTTAERIARLQSSKLKAGSENDLLTLMWLKAKTQGFMGTSVEYHRVGDDLHVNCACTTAKLKYRPIDELLAVFLVYLYRGY